MDKNELINILEQRFLKYPERHVGIAWENVCRALQDNDIEVLLRMEETGGEVDVVKEEKGHFLFFDCSQESPAKRRSLCYDEAALAARKANKPAGSIEKMAAEIGAEILDEEDYLLLQSLGGF